MWRWRWVRTLLWHAWWKICAATRWECFWHIFRRRADCKMTGWAKFLFSHFAFWRQLHLKAANYARQQLIRQPLCSVAREIAATVSATTRPVLSATLWPRQIKGRGLSPLFLWHRCELTSGASVLSAKQLTAIMLVFSPYLNLTRNSQQRRTTSLPITFKCTTHITRA